MTGRSNRGAPKALRLRWALGVLVSRGALAALAALAPPSLASAQEGRVYDVERFRPAPDPDGFLGITGTRTPGPWHYDVSLVGGYATEQLVLRDEIDGSRRVVLTDRVMTDLVVQIGLFGIVALVVDAPVVLFQRGDGPTLDGGPAIPSGAIRDPRIAGRIRLLGEDATRDRDRHEGEGLAIQAAATIPVGHQHSFAGEGAPQLELEVLGDFHILDVGIGGVVGARHRFAEPHIFNEPPYRDELRNQLYFGIALQVPTFVIEELHSLAEVDVTTDLENPFAQLSSTVVEWRIGLRLRLRDLAITAAGGSGLVGGVGSPAFRGIVGLTWSPRVHDRDHDGIVDDRDECASLPEDFDDNEDTNGCPEPDNDHDLVPDLDDRCPEVAPEGFDADDDGCTDPVVDSDGDGILDDSDGCPADAEDSDGFSDEDGCVDPDDDGDHVLDATDFCREMAEDQDGFEDTDGCPDNDDDRDGVLDGNDACPREAEDSDAFEATDGCPEPDDDRDGVLDGDDTCPTEIETLNGVTDEDGCADRGGRARLRVMGAAGGAEHELTGTLRFTARDGSIPAAMVSVVDELARRIAADWGWAHVVELGTPPEGATVALAAALAARGVAGVEVGAGAGAAGSVVVRRGARDRESEAGRIVAMPMSAIPAPPMPATAPMTTAPGTP